jgi:HTH-type transcriptional regulator, competence development regulator
MRRGTEAKVTLGGLLKAARANRQKTLREVEAITGISNGYLSQLESGSIGQPSPNHLHKLADVYSIPYVQLMEAAGYAVATVGASERESSENSFPGLDELTDEDRLKIQAYINDLRDARRARASQG